MEQPNLFNDENVPPKRRPKTPSEYKIIALRDCPTSDSLRLCDTPDSAVAYWRMHITPHPWFDPDRECLVVLLVNTRRRVKGHQLVSTGLLDQILVHSRETFRAAIVAAAHAVIVMHNHPSGDPSPSDADIRVTRDLMRAGQLLKIELLDHIIVGHSSHRSLREGGFMYH